MKFSFLIPSFLKPPPEKPKLKIELEIEDLSRTVAELQKLTAAVMVRRDGSTDAETRTAIMDYQKKMRETLDGDQPRIPHVYMKHNGEWIDVTNSGLSPYRFLGFVSQPKEESNGSD